MDAQRSVTQTRFSTSPSGKRTGPVGWPCFGKRVPLKGKGISFLPAPLKSEDGVWWLCLGSFSPWGHKCLNCTSAGKGIERGSGLLVTCESMGTPEVTAQETLAQKVGFHHGEVSVPATSCTAAHLCALLLSRHTRGCSQQQNRAHRDQLQNYLQITSQIKHLVCFVVFFFFFS